MYLQCSGSGLDPDSINQWIRIRIRSLLFLVIKTLNPDRYQPKMLDPDQMNTDPEHWLYSGFWHDFFKDPIRRFFMHFQGQFRRYRVSKECK
jgi:hypothetical protein